MEPEEKGILNMVARRTAGSAGVLLLLAWVGSAEAQISIDVQDSGTNVLLQAVSIVDDQTVWVSGHGGTWAVTRDAGVTWSPAVMPGEAELQFRDVAAFDGRTAYLMSSGTGDQSRIYRTDDGGGSWVLQYQAEHPEAFIDCMDFWTAEQGLVYGDAVDGVPFLLRTDDGGRTWSRVPAAALQASLEGEGGFAASGSCVRMPAPGVAYVAMGNAERARVLHTDDYGVSWRVVDVPVVAGAASGLTTVDVAPDGRGVALGGAIGGEPARTANVATTDDSGRTWSAAGLLSFDGPAYGGARLGDEGVVAVGPGGLAWSADRGRTWTTVDDRTWWAVEIGSNGVGWAVGPDGRIARLERER